MEKLVKESTIRVKVAVYNRQLVVILRIADIRETKLIL